MTYIIVWPLGQTNAVSVEKAIGSDACLLDEARILTARIAHSDDVAWYPPTASTLTGMSVDTQRKVGLALRELVLSSGFNVRDDDSGWDAVLSMADLCWDNFAIEAEQFIQFHNEHVRLKSQLSEDVSRRVVEEVIRYFAGDEPSSCIEIGSHSTVSRCPVLFDCFELTEIFDRENECVYESVVETIR